MGDESGELGFDIIGVLRMLLAFLVVHTSVQLPSTTISSTFAAHIDRFKHLWLSLDHSEHDILQDSFPVGQLPHVIYTQDQKVQRQNDSQEARSTLAGVNS